MNKPLILICIFMLLTGCTKESIAPSAEPEVLGAYPLSFEVGFDDLAVDEFGRSIGNVPIVGSVFQRLAGIFADMAINDENGTEIEIEPTVLDFPELGEVDFDYVKEVSLGKVHLRVANNDIDNASLSFIKKIEVFLRLAPEVAQRAGAEESILILAYDKERDTLGCLAKCFDMRVSPIDWRSILMEARQFSIETKVTVDAVPKVEVRFGGDLKFNVLVDLGF